VLGFILLLLLFLKLCPRGLKERERSDSKVHQIRKEEKIKHRNASSFDDCFSNGLTFFLYNVGS
jgi:hypothetical protein